MATTATLADVGKRALEDPEFWRSLRANPSQALAQAGYTLAPGDLRLLEEALTSNRVAFELSEFVQGAHDMPNALRWKGAWVAGFPGRWPPIPRS
jgi:hypothetical protein